MSCSCSPSATAASSLPLLHPLCHCCSPSATAASPLPPLHPLCHCCTTRCTIAQVHVMLQGGYDLKVGTSERGTIVPGPECLQFPAFQHLLIGFGGPQGLEQCVLQDPVLQAMHDSPQPEKLFNLYCNTCPKQGSRTIRTEEAVLISLSFFQSAISKHATPLSTVAA